MRVADYGKPVVKKKAGSYPGADAMYPFQHSKYTAGLLTSFFCQFFFWKKKGSREFLKFREVYYSADTIL